MSDLNEKLEQLRAQILNPEDREAIRQWEKQARRAMLHDDLKKHDGPKLIVQELKRKIAQINVLLTGDRNLTDQDRRDLFTQRDCWEWLTQLFDTSGDKVVRIEERLENELERLNEM